MFCKLISLTKNSEDLDVEFEISIFLISKANVGSTFEINAIWSIFWASNVTACFFKSSNLFWLSNLVAITIFNFSFIAKSVGVFFKSNITEASLLFKTSSKAFSSLINSCNSLALFNLESFIWLTLVV